MSDNTLQQNANVLIKEINVIEAHSAVQMSVKLSAALADGWIPYGHTRFGPDGLLLAEVVKYDVRMTDMINTVLDMATVQLAEAKRMLG